MLQLGLMPSHLSLRFLQIMQASRLGLGICVFSAGGPPESEFGLRARLLDARSAPFMVSSTGELLDDDMVGAIGNSRRRNQTAKCLPGGLIRNSTLLRLGVGSRGLAGVSLQWYSPTLRIGRRELRTRRPDDSRRRHDDG